jgi:hypothetical protein
LRSSAFGTAPENFRYSRRSLDERRQEPRGGQAAHVALDEVALGIEDDLVRPGDREALSVVGERRVDAGLRELCLDGEPRLAIHRDQEVDFAPRAVAEVVKVGRVAFGVLEEMA